MNEPKDETTPAAGPEPTPVPAKKKAVPVSAWEVYYPRKDSVERDSVLVASFPMIIYFWPTLVVFLLAGILQWATNLPATALGWCATMALLSNLLVIVTDLTQKKFVIALLTLVVAGLLLYIANQKELGFVSSLGGWVAGLELTYSTHVYLVVGLFLLVFMALGLLQPRMNYWRFEPNEFTHYVQPFGRDQSVPRQGSTVTREIPDVLELVLTFGGGTLVVKREGHVVARIEHVPFLGRRMQALEHMLGVTRVRAVED